jgi:hypothetical protein
LRRAGKSLTGLAASKNWGCGQHRVPTPHALACTYRIAAQLPVPLSRREHLVGWPRAAILGYVFAVAMPIIGFVLGVVMIAKDRVLDGAMVLVNFVRGRRPLGRAACLAHRDEQYRRLLMPLVLPRSPVCRYPSSDPRGEGRARVSFRACCPPPPAGRRPIMARAPRPPSMEIPTCSSSGSLVLRGS